MPNAPEPSGSGRPAWLLPLGAVFVVIVAWAVISGTRSKPAPAEPATPPAAEAPPIARAPLPARPTASVAPDHAPAPAPAPAEDAVTPTPELRQERAGLFEKLAELKDPALPGVQAAFAAQGLRDPATIASGWILAQHWAIFARAEASLAQRIEDEAKRKELAEFSRSILVQAAEREVRGLIGTPFDARLFTDLESLGRGMKDSPPPAAELLPDRAAAQRAPGKRRPKSDLPSEE